MSHQRIKEVYRSLGDRELHFLILDEIFIIKHQINIIMGAFEDIQAQVSTLKGILDTLKTGITTVIGMIGTGGLTAEQAAQVKSTLADLITEGQGEAAQLAAATTPATPPATPGGSPAPAQG